MQCGGALISDLGASASSETNSAIDLDAVKNSDYIVKTDEEGALPVLSEEQLKTACNFLANSGKYAQERPNGLKFIDDVLKVQETYKVNAIFALAVFHEECHVGADTSGRLGNGADYNIGSITGNYNGKSYDGYKVYPSFEAAIDDFGVYIANGTHYFTQGIYTVSGIANIYCDSSWGDRVKTHIDGLYEAAGVQVADNSSTGTGEGKKDNNQKVENDKIGYTGTYTVGGKTFKEWKQFPLDGSQGSGWAGWLRNSGCGLTSAAIVLGAKDSKITPYYLYHYEHGRGPKGSVYITQYIKDAKAKYTVAKNLDDIKKALQSGKKVIACLNANATINGESWAGGSGHYITFLDIKNGDEVYVSNPGANPTHKNGWVKLNSFSNKLFFPHTYLIGL